MLGKYKCIRDYSECTKVIRDTLTGQLMGVDFQHTLHKGNYYLLLNKTDKEITIQNEQGNETKMDIKMAYNYFDL